MTARTRKLELKPSAGPRPLLGAKTQVDQRISRFFAMKPHWDPTGVPERSNHCFARASADSCSAASPNNDARALRCSSKASPAPPRTSKPSLPGTSKGATEVSASLKSTKGLCRDLLTHGCPAIRSVVFLQPRQGLSRHVVTRRSHGSVGCNSAREGGSDGVASKLSPRQLARCRPKVAQDRFGTTKGPSCSSVLFWSG